ncbi:MAG TPA: ACP phosphodiesterase [Bacteroidia bacterium]|nr:ACP phosphodiesterase [Bacteroidia bacterium]
MNFLAHFYLSGTNENLLSGNFIADAVKGSDLSAFPEGIREGIIMHRQIDHFTDRHPVVMKSIKRLRPDFHHYSPVITDIFFDHFLATNWNEYSEEPLAGYAARTYAILEKYVDVFPEKSKRILPFMKQHDWLTIYSRVEGVHNVLTGMSRRTTFDSGMERAAEALVRDYDAFGDDFRKFFPDIIAHTQKFRS